MKPSDLAPFPRKPFPVAWSPAAETVTQRMQVIVFASAVAYKDGADMCNLAGARMSAPRDQENNATAPVPGLAPPPAVILVEPQMGENIGMVARAMANFALAELRLVAPRQGWPQETAFKAASGANGILEEAAVFASLEEALADLHFVLATTARPRDMVKPVMSPKTAAADLLHRRREGQRCAILFGRESVGLRNDQVVLADAIVTAPVNPDFASLNLAQSVLLVAYEIFLSQSDGTLGRRTAFDGPLREGVDHKNATPASRAALFALFEHLEGELDHAGYFPTPETRVHMVRSLRNMIHRMAPSEQDVRTLRGVVAALSRKRRTKPDVS